MAGIGNPSPYHVFVETVRACRLDDSPIMRQPDPAQALPARLPRRAPNPFPGRKAAARGPPLRVHRVPAGEDHQHLCRLHLLLPHPPRGLLECRIPPDRLAGVFRKISSESLDGVVARTEPGPVRDRILRRWLELEMVQRLSGRRRVADGRVGGRRTCWPPHSPIAAAVLQPGYGRAPAASRATGRTRPGRWAGLSSRATAKPSVGEPLEIARWTVVAPATPGGLDRRPAAESPARSALTDGDDGRAELRFAELVGGEGSRRGPLGPRVHAGCDSTWPKRRTGELLVRARVTIHPAGSAGFLHRRSRPEGTLAAGRPLAERPVGCCTPTLSVLGLHDRRRMTLTRERQPGTVLPEPVAGDARRRIDAPATKGIAAYFTEQTAALCLDVGLVKHRSLRRPSSSASPSPSAEAATESGHRCLDLVRADPTKRADLPFRPRRPPRSSHRLRLVHEPIPTDDAPGPGPAPGPVVAATAPAGRRGPRPAGWA